MIPVGVVHGRFQGLHHDHMAYILAGKARCRHLVVGITNPDPTLTRPDDSDPHRSDPAANPLTYYERYRLVRAALVEAHLEESTFSVVPFPINFPHLYSSYMPLDAAFFLTIYDDWGRRKRQLFQSLGLKTEVLWEKPLSQKAITGRDLRQRMARGEPWDHLVPPAVAILLVEWGVPERLRRLLAPLRT